MNFLQMPEFEKLHQSKSDRVLIIQKSLMKKAKEVLMRSDEVEEVLYLYGYESGNRDIVLTLGVPKAKKTYGHYYVEVDDMEELAEKAFAHDMICFGQMHTHPKSVKHHSDYDNENSLSTANGFLSFVVLNYGKVSFNDFSEITVHEAWDGKWDVLLPEAVKDRIVIVDDLIDMR